MGLEVAGIPEDVHVVAIGPLTRVAGSPGTAGLTIMGGALAPVVHRGEVRHAESNFVADPAAAHAVLSEPGRRLVPLDVTARMVLDGAAVAALRDVHPKLRRQLDAWPAAVCLHDPLALLVAAGDVEYEEPTVTLAVEDDGRVTTGSGAEQHFLTDADTEGAIRRILDVLIGSR